MRTYGYNIQCSFHYPFSVLCWHILGIQWQSDGDRLQIIHNGRTAWNKPVFIEIIMIGAWSSWKERNNSLFKAVIPYTESWSIRFKRDFFLLVYRTKEELHQFIQSLVYSF
jgi:hypothetical protein